MKQKAKTIGVGYVATNAVKIGAVVAGGFLVGMINLASHVTMGKELISEKALDNLIKNI